MISVIVGVLAIAAWIALVTRICFSARLAAWLDVRTARWFK